MISARVKGYDAFSWENLGEPLSRAVSASLKDSIWNLERKLNQTVRDSFFVPEDPAKLSLVSFKQRKGQIYLAELSYRYKAIPLSRYPVKQYRITTGNKILSVKRGAGAGRNPKAFTQRIVNRATIRTDVKIRKRSGWKTVQDMQGLHGEPVGLYGFLHTGRKKGEIGYNGQTNSFSAKIFKRKQQPTWAGGERLPIRQLFGPSVTELMQSKEAQKTLSKFLDSNEVFASLQEHLK